MERELWKLLYEMALKLDRPFGSWKFSTSDILAVYLWAVVHDRPTYWAVQAKVWPDDLRPVLPSQSTMSRRLRQHAICQLMLELEQAQLALLTVTGWWLRALDGKPLTVGGYSKDADAGYGRGAGGKAKGYKLHAIWAGGPLPVAWGLAPLNVSEHKMAKELIRCLPGSGYLLADGHLDPNALYDLAHENGYQLLSPRRRSRKGGLGHTYQSEYRLRCIELLKSEFGKDIYAYRGQIERDFGNLTSFGGGLTCLPPWVRRFPRVRNWVHGKLLVNAARWLYKHPPQTIAVA
jgi:hypothetical protein